MYTGLHIGEVTYKGKLFATHLLYVDIFCVVISEPAMVFDSSDFPRSYQGNSKREKIFLSYAENFREQYAHLYPNRRPLLLFPVNEFGVEVKLVTFWLYELFFILCTLVTGNR